MCRTGCMLLGVCAMSTVWTCGAGLEVSQWSYTCHSCCPQWCDHVTPAVLSGVTMSLLSVLSGVTMSLLSVLSGVTMSLLLSSVV